MSPQSIPVIDYASGGARDSILKSVHETGFAVLANHPIELSLIHGIIADWACFFSGSQKYDYRYPDSGLGYFPPPPQEVQAKDGTQLDRKEYFQLRSGAEVALPDISGEAVRYFTVAMAFASEVLSWIDAGMAATAQVSSSSLAKLVTAGRSTLRIQRYLPLKLGEADQVVRSLPHEDIDLITILPSSSVPGLQVQAKQGHWLDVPHGESFLVINAGLILAALTDGWYPAATHRVVASGENDAGQFRISLPLFVHPRADAMISEGTCAADFVAARVAELKARGWQPMPGPVATSS